MWSNHAELRHGVVTQHLEFRGALPVLLSIIRDEMTAKRKKFWNGRNRDISK
jgi:hypothetical protein